MHKVIVNANIVTPNGIVFDGTLVIENNRIYDILTADKALPVNA